MSARLVVHHVGPDPSTIGGMATVIRVMTESKVGGDVVDSYPTWKPADRSAGTRLSLLAARALIRAPTTDIAHVHLSERGSFLREGALLMLARRRGLVTVVTLHGASLLPFARKHRSLVAFVLRQADSITCLDQETLEFVGQLAADVPAVILPNPVPVDEAHIPADETDELVVFAGEISLRKGADVLHRAWPLVAQRRPMAQCLMVGPRADFTPPPTERLLVSPPTDPAAMKETLQRARVVVLPSRAEAMPMALVEAMSLGRPFVSTPVGGIPELATAGGVLVAVGDELSLADRLTELLADGDLARDLGERGRSFCLETRSVDVIDERLRALYSNAIRGRSASPTAHSSG